MTVPSQYITNPILSPNPRIPWIDAQTGQLSTTGLQMLQQMFTAIQGLTPTIACDEAFAANVYTLTPVNIAPNVPNYFDYWSFAFVATNTSTGSVTATVVPRTGTLPTLKVYKTNGSAQAGAGDIVSGLFYVLYFVDSLDSGNGGLVLK